MQPRTDTAAWGEIIARNVLARVSREQHEHSSYADNTRRVAVELAGLLAREPDVKRVILFGSLAGEGGIVHERSDIDLAVEGLTVERASALGSQLAEHTTRYIDLVRWESASEGLRKQIERWGEVLYVAA